MTTRRNRLLVITLVGAGLLGPAALVVGVPHSSAASRHSAATADKAQLPGGYDDPAAEDLRDQRAKLQKSGKPFISSNLAALYLDVTSLTKAPGPLQLSHSRGQVVDVAAMDPIRRAALNLTDPAIKRVLILTGVSDPESGFHSEPKVLAQGVEALKRLGVKDPEHELAVRGRAIGSERSFCTGGASCTWAIKQTIPNAKGFWLTRHTPGQKTAADNLQSKWSQSLSADKDRRDQATKIRGALDADDAQTGSPTALEQQISKPGGIDFSELNLRYLSDEPSANGRQVQYAFTAPAGRTSKVQDGVHSVTATSDAFFVWMALPKSSFWVNLNPNEPNRVIEKSFGRTDAGRVLLQADLELKRTVGRLIDPRTSLGKQYWDKLQGQERCVSMRQWIVPLPATVRATDTQLSILDAPLDVKMETQYLSAKNKGEVSSCRRGTAAEQANNERVYRQMVLPRVKQAVNHGPQFADLRKVYLSRVAAEWVTGRNAKGQPTAYDDVVGSGDISPWVTKTGWTPRQTFDAYRKDYVHKQWKVETRERRGNYVRVNSYVYGGVDLSRLSFKPVAPKTYDKQWGTFAKRTKDVPASSRPLFEGTRAYVGGAVPTGSVAPPTGPKPPQPTLPVPTEPAPTPTSTPSSPAPTPTPSATHRSVPWPTSLPKSIPTKLPKGIPTELPTALPTWLPTEMPKHTSPAPRRTTSSPSTEATAETPSTTQQVSGPPVQTDFVQPEESTSLTPFVGLGALVAGFGATLTVARKRLKR
ncbi:hypothetical protein [Luteipulveratus mongoliensis]|uniref:Uncharacterized protein n=1 Tax=Luteipulveratus mongoliensis TaxID=571913 RepID=A0A0K1JEP0_9MICO|nr:hypothetical protein [Luteipulveratus mongoliensis]AKU15169.1 hypothetical protein VV02_03665 [Luteipulveratus mongoliensis]